MIASNGSTQALREVLAEHPKLEPVHCAGLGVADRDRGSGLPGIDADAKRPCRRRRPVSTAGACA